MCTSTTVPHTPITIITDQVIVIVITPTSAMEVVAAEAIWLDFAVVAVSASISFA